MKRFFHPSRSPFFALLLSLLLIGSQQAAFAHLLSHVKSASGAVTQVVAQYQDNHSSLDGAAETCTSCIAFAGVGGSAPLASSFAAFASFDSDIHTSLTERPLFTRLLLTHRARAPPLFL